MLIVEENLEFILKGVAQNKSAGTIADELAFKGILVEPKAINEYLREHNIERGDIIKADRFIGESSGFGNEGILNSSFKLTKNR